MTGWGRGVPLQRTPGRRLLHPKRASALLTFPRAQMGRDYSCEQGASGPSYSASTVASMPGRGVQVMRSRARVLAVRPLFLARRLLAPLFSVSGAHSRALLHRDGRRTPPNYQLKSFARLLHLALIAPETRKISGPQFPNGVASAVSFVSTTNTARSLAGCVSLAFALTRWIWPGSSEKHCPAV